MDREDPPTDEDERAARLREAETAYEAEIEANLRRNYAANLAHGLLGQTGFRLVNAPTFVPAYIYLLSGSEFLVGLALAAQWLGASASSIFGATLIEHRKRVLPMGLLIGWGMRAGVLGLALGGFFLPDRWALITAIGFLCLFGLFNGMQAVIFNTLMAKVIPLRLRGRLTGFRNFAAGLTAAGVSWMGGHYFVEGNLFGNGYASTFMMAFILTSIGLSLLMLVREPEPPTIRARATLGGRLHDIPMMLKADPALARFYLAAGLAALGTMAVPFYILYAGERIGLSGATIGILSTAFLLAQTTTNLLWGSLADRFGNRLVFILSVATWGAATVLLLAVDTLWPLAIAFAGLGAGQGGFQNSNQNIIVEFGARDDLPMRIAMLNTATSLMHAAGPLLGGVIAYAISFDALFALSIAVLLAAVLTMIFLVDEPRKRRKTP
ncbi:MAG: MFS transporter [Parvibaculum sp.]|uniref:MFS transporter n=1 Tax=Parvibaculum sp. TaxID=2024848 RepID=UPI0027173632|nr:MFS transporter [Parvibaculum sp.]MDO8837312.1 MFS transporter [Parvibaculum sp.]